MDSLKIIITLFCLCIIGCSTSFENQVVINKFFPEISGSSLEGNRIQIPLKNSAGHQILLIGYEQNSQFDIDRWLIGFSMLKVSVPIYELPVLAGWFPKFLRKRIDNGMRSGIPKKIWKSVITVYNDGDKVKKFLGSENPRNARVVLLDKNGKIISFFDDGFSVQSLNELVDKASQGIVEIPN